MLDHEQYNKALDIIMTGEHLEGFSKIAELYQTANKDEREGILSMLTDVFYVPNFKTLHENYESNRRALLTYPYWFGPQIPDICDISMTIFPINGNIWFLYDTVQDTFKPVEINSEIETKYFFHDLNKPIFIQDEANEFNLKFVTDNVRPSEDVAMDNHIYLYYEKYAELLCILQAFNITGLIKFKKIVFLIGTENKDLYPLDFKRRYNIDYSRMPKKPINIKDIKRLFFGWVIHGFSGASFLAQIIDFHPDVLTHPNDTLEKFYLLNDILTTAVPVKFIDSFFLLPHDNIFRAEITKLVCYGKEIKNELEKKYRLEQYLRLLKLTLRGYSAPTYIDWIKAIMLAYNLYNGREFEGRVFPAMFFAPHGYIDRQASTRNFCVNMCRSFSYCRVLIPIRDPLAMSGSMVGCVYMRAMPAPSAQWIDVYTFGFYQHFRSQDDMIYKFGTLIRFEDLKLNLRATIASMIEMLNIPYSESLMTTTINGVICGNTHSHIRNFSDGLDSSPVYWHIKNNEFLDEHDKYRIEMLVWKYYSYFGYEPKFYDGKYYTWEQVEHMMQEPMKCDILDIEKRLCEEKDIIERRKRNVLFWKRRFEEPIPKNTSLLPLKVLEPKKKLLKTDLYK